VEVFLLEPRDAGAAGRQRWSALIGASRAPRPGSVLACEGGLRVLVSSDPSDAGGQADVELFGVADVSAWLEVHGRPPLPPYIRRSDDDPRLESDRKRYQTVFASQEIGRAHV
jgi:S-adenosylmethionine:tRNA ribosyltransferase-isomerase